MPWYVYVIYFFVGAFAMNSVPHIVQGVSGNKFQTPFATPRGVGESSAVVNVVWGVVNVAVAGALVHAFFPDDLPPPWPLCAVTLLGALAIGLYLASHFGKVRSDGPKP